MSDDLHNEIARLYRENDDLRARLAKVEDERDQWQEDARRFCQNADYWRGRAVTAEARLAAVLALCDQWDDLPSHVRRDIDAFVVMREVRAAARGEGDRPAECRNPQTHTPGCGCKALDEFPPIKPMADPDDDDAWDRLNLPTARGEGDRG